MTTIDKSAPVLVTGASGYVAGWLVKKLLDEGLTVHAAVRDPNNTKRLSNLRALGSEEKLKFFKTDLLEAGSYDEAMQGCELVYHTASPFVIDVENPQRDLVDPAVKGTANVLESANRVDSVKRVVVTSSCASIYGDNLDCQNKSSGVMTEDDWNETSALNHLPYSYSKVMAEKEAWKIADAQNRWDLVVINPSLVLGPAIDPQATSESFTQMIAHGDGTNKQGLPDYAMGTVDVREVAEAHFKAGFTPDAKGRHIVSATDSSFLQVGQKLHKKYGDKYPIGHTKVPKFLLWMIAPIVTKGVITRKIVSRNVGIPLKLDNTKAKQVLGIQFRPEEDSLYEMFDQMIEAGRV